MFKSPWFWLGVIAVSIAAYVFIVRSRKTDSWGFKDILKNPAIWDEMAEARQNADRDIENAKNWSEDRIAKAVRHFVFEIKSSSQASGEERVLQSLESRIHPPIMQILRDDTNKAKLVAPTGTNLFPESPINRICKLLDKSPPTEAAKLLAPFLDDRSYHIRASIALVLGNDGSTEAVTPLKKALRDPEKHVRSMALIGLQKSTADKRLQDDCKLELFSELQKLIHEDDSAARLLIDFDEKKAAEFLLSPEIMTVSSRSLHNAFVALSAHEIRVPRDRLLSLITDLQTSDLKYPKDYALGDALIQLAEYRFPEDRNLLEGFVDHASREVASGAAAGLIVHSGLKGFLKKIEDKEKIGGYEALSIQQKYYTSVFELDGEINNGGISQYFVNSSGDHWRDALAGLEAMGLKERTTILREAATFFGSSGPSPDRDQRQDQLARLARKNDALFDDLDTRYFDCKESIDVFATQYVLKNADAFK